MASQLCVVGKNSIVCHLTVVRQVNVSHYPVVIADSCCTRIPSRANVESTKFANNVAVSNDQFTWFACVLFVLRYSAQRIELKYLIVFAYCGSTFNDAMGADTGASSNPHVRAYGGERPNNDRVIQVGRCIYQS
jgi:hypothetical protein